MLELVFHPPDGSSSEAFSLAVQTILAASESELRIVSPYLGGRVLGSIIEERSFRLVTDLEACFDAGASQEAAAIMGAHLPCVRNCPDVHAKVVFNDAAALIGSANLTERGFAHRDEMGCLIRESGLLATLAEWFEALWSSSEAIRAEYIESLVTRSKRRAALRRSLEQQHELASTPSRSRHNRSLGWMKIKSAAAPPQMSPGPFEVDAKERAELSWILAKRTGHREEAIRILELLSEALEVSGLDVDDSRLHLRFKKSVECPIHVTINQRYVAWLEHRDEHSMFGFILDDAALAEQIESKLQPHVRASWFKRPRVPTLHVSLDHLADVVPAIQESWHRAIRTEVDRLTKHGKPRTSSYLKSKRPSLYAVLTEPALRREIASQIGRAHV
jgi:hypothetical protein